MRYFTLFVFFSVILMGCDATGCDATGYDAGDPIREQRLGRIRGEAKLAFDVFVFDHPKRAGQRGHAQAEADAGTPQRCLHDQTRERIDGARAGDLDGDGLIVQCRIEQFCPL